MTFTCREIGDLVVRIQSDFLKAPLLTLSVAQAQRRYQVSRSACQAVLEALAESRVLARTPEGTYARWFPGRYARYAPAGFAA